MAYTAPEQHPSDWRAPEVALPGVTLPYGPSPQATADPAFYDVTTLDAAEVGAAPPGGVLRSEPVELTGPLRDAAGWRILYRSTDAAGEPAVVSGIVLVPDGPEPPEGRPVAAWAHGTTGIADRCAPSATRNLFYDDYGQVGRDLLDQGFVVAATDYHGLGTPGVHTYHHSEELARATLDSVAAAHGLDEAGPLADGWLVVGHSEGGLAALAADERTGLHPPGLDYRGAVVAAPSAQLGAVVPAMFAVPGRGYAVMLLEAVAEDAPDLDPAVALGDEAAGREALLTHGCWEEAVPGFDDIPPEEMLADPSVGTRLGEVLARCCSSDPASATGPLLVVHGEMDESLPPALTDQLVADLCAAGVVVDHRTYPGAGHDAVMAASSRGRRSVDVGPPRPGGRSFDLRRGRLSPRHRGDNEGVPRRCHHGAMSRLRQRLRVPATAVTVVLLGAVGCTDGDEPASGDADRPEDPAVVVDGLEGPTQITDGPEGRLLVAQLNGPEGQPVGQVLEVDLDSGEQRVLLEGLETPTGVLWLDGRLWVMERRSLSSAEWDGDRDPAPREVVLDDLPFNGRSEGTLTALPDGRILYETSGSLNTEGVLGGSGALWALDPSTGESEPFATGLKNAYAHAVRADGSVLVTEIGDNIADPPPDELHLFEPAGDGAAPDGGWPDCPPPRQCPDVTGPAATFPAGDTPTGVAAVGDRAVVALFVAGALVEVDVAAWAPGDGPVATTTVLEGLDGPHTVLARDDGELWVSEHGAGRVVSYRP